MLAIVDVCVNEVTPIVFYDDEGYDIVPFNMIKVIHDHDHSEKDNQENTTITKDFEDNIVTGIKQLNLQEEVSI